MAGAARTDHSRLQQARIAEFTPQDFRELAQFMRLSRCARQYVLNRDVAHKKGIGEQPAVTPPPHSLGAHHRGRRGGAERDQFVDRLPKRARFHMIRVAAETGVPPGRILRIRSRFSHPTKRWNVPILDQMSREKPLERRRVVLGVAPGSRETADVGQLLNPVGLKQRQEGFDWMDRVTNRVDYGRAHAG